MLYMQIFSKTYAFISFISRSNDHAPRAVETGRVYHTSTHLWTLCVAIIITIVYVKYYLNLLG
jgi:hypothetical protein